ncbi:MAG: DUF87 domain-containing protein [Anaerolineaceae bacterium]|nr:DUF87 domain-containing protein [Anaerolineaceae bacterium]
MQNINEVLKQQKLLQLIQVDNFVGWVYYIDYDKAHVMTNDLWKSQASGVPHNCFLVAATFNPERYTVTPEEEREIILLRVVGSAKLPQDDDLIRTKIDNYQQQTGIYGETNPRDYDDITRNQLQFGGLECNVLGTFFQRDGELWLGSDLESFATASRLNVFRPRNKALEIIVNHLDPLRRQKAIEDAQQLGIQKPIAPFQIGTVRYTSTDRLHRRVEDDKVPVRIQPSDFLARRTAVLGMTRTGKSNMVKQTVSVVKRIADESAIPIGQIIYDMNGEYANANQQDKGAIADVYPDETIRYRMLKTAGFKELQNNFFIQLPEGHKIIRDFLEEKRLTDQQDIGTFINASFDEPEEGERSSFTRWQVRIAAYQALLYIAGFEAPSNHQVKFRANLSVRNAVDNAAGTNFQDPARGLSLDQAVQWFIAAREANGGAANNLQSSNGNAWLDNDTRAILNLIAKKNDNGSYIRGYNNLVDAIPYHSSRRSDEVGDEIYQHLVDGKIIILDLSVGNPQLRDRISKQIATDIFNKSMGKFIEGVHPPNIVVYIEEAHNLIGRGMALTDTWPRLAKEGAKYRIALVYATQEVSSVHPNILANTENWFITHINNDREIRELSHFYDFGDFSRSLIRAQDVGFTRVKTLSGPFVIPVQIDKFDPQAEIDRQKSGKATLVETAVSNATPDKAADQSSEEVAWDDLFEGGS